MSLTFLFHSIDYQVHLYLYNNEMIVDKTKQCFPNKTNKKVKNVYHEKLNVLNYGKCIIIDFNCFSSCMLQVQFYKGKHTAKY